MSSSATSTSDTKSTDTNAAPQREPPSEGGAPGDDAKQVFEAANAKKRAAEEGKEAKGDDDSDSDDDLSDDIEIDETKLPNFLHYPNVKEEEADREFDSVDAEGKPCKVTKKVHTKLTILWGPERLIDEKIFDMYKDDLGPDSPIEYLRLILCYFAEDVAAKTFALIAQMPRLDKLEVIEVRNACVVGEDGKKMKGGGVKLPLEAMLAKTQSLKELYVMQCDMTLDWTCSLLRSLVDNKVLAELLIEPNEKNETEPRKAMLEVLRHNRVIESLSVWVNTVPENDVDQEILDAVVNDWMLGWLHLGIKREQGKNASMIDQMHERLKKNALAEPKDEHEVVLNTAVALAPMNLPPDIVRHIADHLPGANRIYDFDARGGRDTEFDPKRRDKMAVIQGVRDSVRKVSETKKTSDDDDEE